MLEIKEIISDDTVIEYKENTLTVEEFQELRTGVGWFKATQAGVINFTITREFWRTEI